MDPYPRPQTLQLVVFAGLVAALIGGLIFFLLSEATLFALIGAACFGLGTAGTLLLGLQNSPIAGLPLYLAFTFSMGYYIAGVPGLGVGAVAALLGALVDWKIRQGLGLIAAGLVFGLGLGWLKGGLSLALQTGLAVLIGFGAYMGMRALANRVYLPKKK